MLDLILMTLSSLLSGLRGQAALQAENIALRHQVTVLQRTHTKRPVLKPGDRCLWVWLSRLWSGWRSALIIVMPETVIGWHRQGFRWYWTWKIRHGRSGRPRVPKETRDLIRTMSRENPCGPQIFRSSRKYAEQSGLVLNGSKPIEFAMTIGIFVD